MPWMRVVLMALLLSDYAISQDDVLPERFETLRQNFALSIKSKTQHELALALVQILVSKVQLNKTDDIEKSDLVNRIYVQTMVEEYETRAAKRIPCDASEHQRAKLRLAAFVDVRRTIYEMKESSPMVPKRFELANRAGDLDIFGSGSLFEKVLRQQGLPNRVTDF